MDFIPLIIKKQSLILKYMGPNDIDYVIDPDMTSIMNINYILLSLYQIIFFKICNKK